MQFFICPWYKGTIYTAKATLPQTASLLLFSKWCRLKSFSAAIGLSHKHRNKAMWEVWCNSPVLTWGVSAILHYDCTPRVCQRSLSSSFWCRTILCSSGKSVTQVCSASHLTSWVTRINIIFRKKNNFPISFHKQCEDELRKYFWHLLTLTTKCLAWWGLDDCYKEECAQKILPEIFTLVKMPRHL